MKHRETIEVRMVILLEAHDQSHIQFVVDSYHSEKGKSVTGNLSGMKITCLDVEVKRDAARS